ncbi:MAG: hypothetical protein GXP16_12360 [Gammaproteobacteria bacterium]|nr:hypothetical protein [Gammaproteobacteria bacterium]
MLQALKYRFFGKSSAQQLSEGEFYEADWLVEKHIIGIKAVGHSITELNLDVQNFSERKIKVLLPRGIYFPARGGHQNMVSTREVVFRLKPGGCKFFAVQVACLNAHREIPSEQDGFGRLKRADAEVAKFIEVACNEAPMVLQAGIWALTDGLNRSELRRRLVANGGVSTHRQVISDRDIDSASLHLAKLSLATQIS